MPQVICKRPFGHGPAQSATDPFAVEAIQKDISSSETTRTAQPPSCIEFYRGDPHVFVVGTYKLLETEQGQSDSTGQQRVGSIGLYRLDPTYSRIQEKHVARFQQAVFDLHFHPKHHDLLGIATSTNKMSFFKLRLAPLSLQYLFTFTAHEDPMALATSFSWSPFPTKKGCISLGVTFSDGWVNYFEDIPLRPQPKTKRTADPIALQSHKLEAWYIAFYLSMTSPHPSRSDPSPKPEIVRRALTGGDDATLIVNDVPKPNLHSSSQPAFTVFSEHRIHQAGVTSILPLPSLRSHLGPGDLILTGSYDENIRLIHISSHTPYQRKVLTSTPLGGGVWRLKFLSDISLDTRHSDTLTKHRISFLLLASCMHVGARILRYTCLYTTSESRKTTEKEAKDANWDVEVLAEFTEHESMNYGCDWTVDDEGKTVVVSTSFYDCRVCVWRPGF